VFIRAQRPVRSVGKVGANAARVFRVNGAGADEDADAFHQDSQASLTSQRELYGSSLSRCRDAPDWSASPRCRRRLVLAAQRADAFEQDGGRFVARVLGHEFALKCAFQDGLSQPFGALEVCVDGRLHGFHCGETALHLSYDALLLLDWRKREWQRREALSSKVVNAYSARCTSESAIQRIVAKHG
jgi:hypothetical protein